MKRRHNSQLKTIFPRQDKDPDLRARCKKLEQQIQKPSSIKLPSGETRQILSACKATVGSVGNSDHALEQSGKAGRSRWLGRRPHNRGVVMNPVDHPMGGGEGRQSGGHPRSRKGLYAKGLKTRAPKKLSNKYIIERAKK